MTWQIIIDSGATKADWTALCQGRQVAAFQTPGIHPFFLSDEALGQAIAQARAQLQAPVHAIHFYGTGCRAEHSRQRLRQQFEKIFPEAKRIETATDVLGAARALCQRQPGIACILGTGSNSVWYDGNEIVQNSGGYGYVLGDEGSGAVLGRELLSAWLNAELPQRLGQAFETEYQLSADTILEKVYRNDAPSRFLASFVPFVARHAEEAFVQTLLKQQFQLFVRRCVLPYQAAHELPVHFTGSVAFYFREALCEVLAEARLQAGIFLKSPMEGLMRYHANDEEAA